MASKVLIVFGIKHKVIDVVGYNIQLVVLARNNDNLIWVKHSIRHELDSAFYETHGNDDALHVDSFLEVAGVEVHGRLQERHKLTELHLTQEVLELFGVWLGQIIALREHLVDVQSMLPHQVLHAVRKPHFGCQSLCSFEVIQLLETGCLEFERISALCCVQKVESVDSVIVRILKVFDRIFNPAFREESLAHVAIQTEHDEDFRVLVNFGVFFPESCDCFSGSLFNLVNLQILRDFALV